MKFKTIYVDNNKIEVFNSILGKETIKVNDEVVSSKYSILGTEHTFSIPKANDQSTCRLTTGFSAYGIAVNLFVNDKPVIESPKGFLRLVLLFFIMGLIIGLL